jgi:hypothetical protein
MKKTWLKTFARTTLAMLLLVVFAQSSAFAQDEAHEDMSAEKKQEDSATRQAKARRLEGVWDVQVTRLNCQTGAVIATVPALLTYMRGGTMSDWGTGTPPSQRSPGHGVWSYDSGRDYTSAFQFFRYNPDGTLAGRQVVRNQIVLSRFGSSFNVTTTAQVLDVNGNVIANNCSTGVGTRFE